MADTTRFEVREAPYADRESWEVWDTETYDIAEPLEDNCDLSWGQASARAAKLNTVPTPSESDHEG